MVNKRFSITCPFAILLNEISAEIKSHTANQAFKKKTAVYHHPNFRKFFLHSCLSEFYRTFLNLTTNFVFLFEKNDSIVLFFLLSLLVFVTKKTVRFVLFPIN